MVTSFARLLCASAIVLAFPAAHAADAPWRALFNGKDLDGWEHVGPGEFVVEDGKLKTIGGLGLLTYTKEKFQNVTLRVVYHKEDSNSGVFIRIPEKPTEPWLAVHRGYEVQIDETDDDFHRTGVLYSFTKALATPAFKEWNTMEITIQGDHTVVVVNGTKVTDFHEGDPIALGKEGEPKRGPRTNEPAYFGLQNHSDKDTVWFKEVSVKPAG